MRKFIAVLALIGLGACSATPPDPKAVAELAPSTTLAPYATVAPTATPTTALADDMAVNRARSTCKKFTDFVAKNRAGTSGVADALEIMETLAIASELAADPVKTAATKLNEVMRDDSAGQGETQAKADELKAACKKM